MSGKSNWYAISKADDNEAEISIYDEIGGWGIGAKEFLGEISKLKGKHLHVRINSPGGSVVEGTAIFNALRRHEGGVTIHIDGLAASMASVIAMAGAPVLIADNALMMIHNPWTITAGDSEDLRKEADLLDKLKDNIRNSYERKTGIESDKLQEMMDAETWLDSIDAVALGFADAIEGGIAAAAHITPEKMRERFDKFAKGMEANPETQAQEPAEPEVAEPAVVEPAEPEVVAEPEKKDEPAEPEAKPVEEPQAAINAQALVEKVQNLVAENSLLRTRAEVAETSLAQLERSLGVAAATIVPELSGGAVESKSLLEQFNEISDPAQRSAFYRKHKAELEKQINKIA